MTEICRLPGPTGKPCGRRAPCWHIGKDVPVCQMHAPRPKPGQVRPSPCCALTMVQDGRKWRCPGCRTRWE